MDKEEITAEARRIGTYEISIVPDEDCCQVFTPKHPATRARREEIDAAEEALPVAEIVQAAMAGVERFDYWNEPADTATTREDRGPESVGR
jgi:tRNA uracil 4-sulfurtransferase